MDIDHDLGELRRLQSAGETRSMTDAAGRLAIRAVVSGEFESVRARFRTVDRDLWGAVRGNFNGAAALARFLMSDREPPLPNRQRKKFAIGGEQRGRLTKADLHHLLAPEEHDTPISMLVFEMHKKVKLDQENIYLSWWLGHCPDEDAEVARRMGWSIRDIRASVPKEKLRSYITWGEWHPGGEAITLVERE